MADSAQTGARKHGSNAGASHHARPVRPWGAASVTLLLAAAGGLVALLALVLSAGKVALPLDEGALATALSLRSEWLTNVMRQITGIVMPATLSMVALSLTALGHGPRPTLTAMVSVACATALNWFLKMLIARSRPPEELRLAVETSSSFPSSHAVSVVAFYGCVIWLIWRYQRASGWRTAQIAIFALAILLVGMSRVYLAVHYLSDVLAGYCAALIWLVIYTRLVAPRILGNR